MLTLQDPIFSSSGVKKTKSHLSDYELQVSVDAALSILDDRGRAIINKVYFQTATGEADKELLPEEKQAHIEVLRRLRAA